MASQQQIGGWAFIAGAIIAIIAGVLVGAGKTGMLQGTEVWVPLVLVLLGIIVGFLNIKDKEIDKFLIASLTLLALAASAGGMSIIPGIGTYLAAIVQQVSVFVAPAAIIGAIKSIHGLASEQVN